MTNNTKEKKKKQLNKDDSSGKYYQTLKQGLEVLEIRYKALQEEEVVADKDSESQEKEVQALLQEFQGFDQQWRALLNNNPAERLDEVRSLYDSVSLWREKLIKEFEDDIESLILDSEVIMAHLQFLLTRPGDDSSELKVLVERLYEKNPRHFGVLRVFAEFVYVHEGKMDQAFDLMHQAIQSPHYKKYPQWESSTIALFQKISKHVRLRKGIRLYQPVPLDSEPSMRSPFGESDPFWERIQEAISFAQPFSETGDPKHIEARIINFQWAFPISSEIIQDQIDQLQSPLQTLHWESLYWLAQQYRWLDPSGEKSLALLGVLKEALPDSLWVRAEYGQVLLTTRDQEEIRSHENEVREIVMSLKDSGNPYLMARAYFFEGVLEMSLDKYAEAERLFNLSWHFNPDLGNVLARIKRAEVLHQQMTTEEGVEHIDAYERSLKQLTETLQQTSLKLYSYQVALLFAQDYFQNRQYDKVVQILVPHWQELHQQSTMNRLDNELNFDNVRYGYYWLKVSEKMLESYHQITREPHKYQSEFWSHVINTYGQLVENLAPVTQELREEIQRKQPLYQAWADFQGLSFKLLRQENLNFIEQTVSAMKDKFKLIKDRNDLKDLDEKQLIEALITFVDTGTLQGHQTDQMEQMDLVYAQALLAAQGQQDLDSGVQRLAAYRENLYSLIDQKSREILMTQNQA